MRVAFHLLLLFLTYNFSFGQSISFFEPINFKTARENGTRTANGEPGQNYWQNSADYSMKVDFDPAKRKLKGYSKIIYKNNSPDSLQEIVIHTYPNIFKKGSARDVNVKSADVMEGMTLESLKIGGNTLIQNDGSGQNGERFSKGTYSVFPLNQPLLPNKQIEIEVDWHFTLNKETHLRVGQTGPTGFMIAYFFPHIGVYDDIEGWNKYAYSGQSEFYSDFGDFEVEVKVPQDYLVWSSGSLQNPTEVLQKEYYERYHKALESSEKVKIVDASDVGKNITETGNNTWKFKAGNVPDFAMAIAKDYLWDARTIGDVEEECVTINTVYDPNSKDFERVNDFTAESITFMTNVFPKIVFPFRNHTVFNGLGMMEYPGMANDKSFEDLDRTRWLTHHETFHSYFPFMVGLNESKYAWLDEGLTMFGTNEYLRVIDSPLKDWIGYQSFKGIIGFDSDFPIFATSKLLKNPVYFNSSYPKTTSFFIVLQEYMGKDGFTSFIQKFAQIWKGKHPTAMDFLFLLDKYTGENLRWFIKPWIYDFGYVDLSIDKLKETDSGFEVTLGNRGNYPAPVHLEITYADGTVDHKTNSVEVWKHGATDYTITISTDKNIERLVLRDISLIDANPNNNILKP